MYSYVIQKLYGSQEFTFYHTIIWALPWPFNTTHLSYVEQERCVEWLAVSFREGSGGPNRINQILKLRLGIIWFGKILLNHKKTIENYKSKRNVAQKCYKIGKTMVHPYIHILSDSVTIPKLRYSFFGIFLVRSTTKRRLP